MRAMRGLLLSQRSPDNFAEPGGTKYSSIFRTFLRASHGFDRFHIAKHLNEVVNDVRRSEMRHLVGKEKAEFKSTRWLLLKNVAGCDSDDHNP